MADVPQIPPRLTDPVPVLTIGILGWIVALVVFTATGDRSDDAVATCWSGIAVGALGDIDAAEEGLRQRDLAPRERRSGADSLLVDD